MGFIVGILIVFMGTLSGAACVLLLKGELGNNTKKLLLGFAAGVMMAASVWSLLIPALELAASLGVYGLGGKLVVIPVAVGFLLGIAFLLLLDDLIPHLHVDSSVPEGHKAQLKRSTMTFLAVTLHNIPEGMAVGVVFAAAAVERHPVATAAALTLSVGIAVQNFPEGAIVSMSLKGGGEGKLKAFALGVASGAVEPLAAALAFCLRHVIAAVLPLVLSFAAGAMIYVITEELIPEASSDPHSNFGTLGFAAGFVLMMILDVTLG